MASFTPLSVDEIAFFREYGYLIKRKVLDLELCAQARDALWVGLPDGCPMKKWVAPRPQCGGADTDTDTDTHTHTHTHTH